MIPENLLQYWDGANSPMGNRQVEAKFRWELDGVATDYDRACDVLDYLGLLEVGNGHVLILGDAPMPTTWWAISQSSGLLVRWVWAFNDDSVIAALQNLSTVTWQHPSLRINVGQSPLVMFDSAFAGTESFLESNSIKINLLKGIYEISTAEYKPNSETFLLLHKFELTKD